MAGESSVTVYGNPIDVWTQTDGKQRQAMVIGDPTTQSGVASVVSSGLLVTQQSLTKGVQGGSGISTQDLKDSGRTLKTYSAAFTAATTEAMVTLTPTGTGAAGTTGTTFAVTSGKILRIQSIGITTKNAGAAAQGIVINLRINTGSVIVTSVLAATVAAQTIAATTNATATGMLDIPDGLELSGTMQWGISQVGTATAGNTVTIIAYEY